MQLIKYDTARKALAEAYSVDEVKDIRDKAQAMAAYARQAKDTELVQWATEIKVRAERKCGAMLKESAENGVRATRGRPRKSDTVSHLDDIGINRKQSERWQKLAAMPEEHFETAVATAKEHAGQVTTAHMLRVADEYKKLADMEKEASEVEKECKKNRANDSTLITTRFWSPIASRVESLWNKFDEKLAQEQKPECPRDVALKMLEQLNQITQYIETNTGDHDGYSSRHRHND